MLALGCCPQGWGSSCRAGTGSRTRCLWAHTVAQGHRKPHPDLGWAEEGTGPWGGQPVQLPLPQNETKQQEIFCDLALLVGAVVEARGQVTQECGARQLSQLYQRINFFLLLLQAFSWEVSPLSGKPGHPGTGAGCAVYSGICHPSRPTLVPQAGPWVPGCSLRTMEQTHVPSIFLTYRQLVQGKLRFFFLDLAKDLCKQGQGGSSNSRCGAR